ncbi:MAG: hypothetical protein HQK76_17325 [Desulfobacterales bacterium]|nr:hypothetical protein [Desulfobacterales bacterium]
MSDDHGDYDYDHDHNNIFSNTVKNLLESSEQKELEKRWPIALKELKALLERVKDISRVNPKELHPEISDVDKLRLIDAIYDAIVKDEKPELKRSVARRMANKIATYLLWRRSTTIPLIHELVVLLPWWISNMGFDVINNIRDIGLDYILNGVVVPIQTVWKEVLDSPVIYLGHCVCRSSGLVDDLKHNNKIVTLLSNEDNLILLERFMNRYYDLKDRYNGNIPDTDKKYIDLCEKLENFKINGSPEYAIQTLLQATYAEWEILPVLEKYTPNWIRSMHKNKKAHLIHKELLFEIVNIQFLSRGSIFSSMKVIDSPYTICTCPTPENDGGCVLTNWYYWARSDSSIIPNELVHGRRKDENGELLPCRFFPLRKSKSCIGCGCAHSLPEPRGLKTVLKQADEIFNIYKQTSL